MNQKNKELEDEIKKYLDMVNGDEDFIIDVLYWECKAELKGRQEARKEILEFIEHERDNGNVVNEEASSLKEGFSAGICLSDLMKKLEEK